jgi:uncharacterized caspase-like protein
VACARPSVGFSGASEPSEGGHGTSLTERNPEFTGTVTLQALAFFRKIILNHVRWARQASISNIAIIWSMARFALLIGVEIYSNEQIDNTPYCHNDASRLERLLTTDFDFEEKNVKCLLLAPGDNITLPDLISQIEGLVSGAQVDDTVLLYFAGHGRIHQGELFLVLPDSDPEDWEGTSLPLAAVDHLLRRDRRLCVRILDACHSGLEVGRSARNVANDDQPFWDKIATTPAEGWITFASCGSNERSYWDDGLGHGIYTDGLCRALEAYQPGESVDPFGLGPLIVSKVSESTNRLGKAQTPAVIGRIAGKQVLAVKTAPPSPPSSGNVAQTAVKESDLAKLLDDFAKMDQVTPAHVEAASQKLRHAANLAIERLLILNVQPTLSPKVSLSDLSPDASATVVDHIDSNQLQAVITASKNRRKPSANTPFSSLRYKVSQIDPFAVPDYVYRLNDHERTPPLCCSDGRRLSVEFTGRRESPNITWR